MSENIISAKFEKDGTLLWDRYTPGDVFHPVICPKKDKPCGISCPILMIKEDGEHIRFMCCTPKHAL